MWPSVSLFVLSLILRLAVTQNGPTAEHNCVLTDCKPLPIHEPWCPSEQVPSVSANPKDVGVLMLCCRCVKQNPKFVGQAPRNRLRQEDGPRSKPSELESSGQSQTQSRQAETQLRILDSAGQQNAIAPSGFNENEATPHQFPYIVSLQINGVHKCGGSIIDEKHILTAAHCFSRRNPGSKTVIGLNLNTTGVTIVAGDHELYRLENSEQVRRVSEIHIHPLYNFRSYQQGHDIAVLTLSDCLRFNNIIKPADFLPDDLSVDSEIRALSRSRTTVAGWGGIGLVDRRGREIASNVLLTTSLNVQRCSPGYFKGVLGSVVCALGRNELGMTTDACQGDSGGPMECVIDNGRMKYVCGIVSYGEVCPVQIRSDDGAAGVYTRVSFYRRFIRRVLDGDYYKNVGNC